MRKFLVLMLMATMLLPATVIAEFDNKSLTDEQLVAMHQSLVNELFSREKTATIPIGYYVIGIDIPAGEYQLVGDPSGDGRGQYLVFENAEKRKTREYAFGGQIYLDVTPDSRIFLEDGNILEIEYTGVLMKKSHFTIVFK